MAARILIVDDEESVVDILAATLENFGYESDAAHSGKDALSKVREIKPDLVLMDIKLNDGETDGITIAKEILSGFGIPVVYITGFAEDRYLQRAKETEPYGYLLKPFNNNELKAVIEIALYRAAVEQERRASGAIIKRKLELEKTVSLISSRFIGTFNIEEAIKNSLQDMGKLRKAYHVYFVQLEGKQSLMTTMYEWINDDASPLEADLPREIFPAWIDKLKKGESIHIKTSSQLPAGREKEELEGHGIRSLLVLPVQSGSSLMGFIGIESKERKIEWTEDDVAIFKVSSEVIGRAIEHDLQQKELMKYRCHLEELVEERTSKLRILNQQLEREIAERRASLREKEMMVREIHHRVKNNLQVISSLLNLQAQHIDDPRLLEIFCETRNRVRSMAIIHEKLYQSGDLAHVDFGDYLGKLIPIIFHSFGRTNISHRIEADNIFLSVDCAIPCGLIINELVSNSIKHGFPDGSPGLIQIKAESFDDSNISLTVADNGIGIPLDVESRYSSSLGLQLVRDLADQLEGSLEVKRDGGTQFTLKFRATPITITP
jgi:two-component sensor histidine kinase/CheY-like chemotaxis protein